MANNQPHNPASFAHLRKYPWHRMADGEEITLVRGVDFTCSTKSLDGMARNAASYRRMRARVRVNGDNVTITFFTPTPKERRNADENGTD